MPRASNYIFEGSSEKNQFEAYANDVAPSMFMRPVEYP